MTFSDPTNPNPPPWSNAELSDLQGDQPTVEYTCTQVQDYDQLVVTAHWVDGTQDHYTFSGPLVHELSRFFTLMDKQFESPCEMLKYTLKRLL